MLTKDDLAELRKITREETVSKEELKTEIIASEDRTKKELKQAILDSQTDTIKAVSYLVHEGYNMHEKRMEKIEDRLGLAHPE